MRCSKFVKTGKKGFLSHVYLHFACIDHLLWASACLVLLNSALTQLIQLLLLNVTLPQFISFIFVSFRCFWNKGHSEHSQFGCIFSFSSASVPVLFHQQRIRYIWQIKLFFTHTNVICKLWHFQRWQITPGSTKYRYSIHSKMK